MTLNNIRILSLKFLIIVSYFLISTASIFFILIEIVDLTLNYNSFSKDYSEHFLDFTICCSNKITIFGFCVFICIFKFKIFVKFLDKIK